jgi:hypothetical protein
LWLLVADSDQLALRVLSHHLKIVAHVHVLERNTSDSIVLQQDQVSLPESELASGGSIGLSVIRSWLVVSGWLGVATWFFSFIFFNCLFQLILFTTSQFRIFF